MIGCLPTQTLAFTAVFVYLTHATHATQAIAFELKPGLRLVLPGATAFTRLTHAVFVIIIRSSSSSNAASQSLY